jgi:KDO2-lipid IV(A) lauroyltransferase
MGKETKTRYYRNRLIVLTIRIVAALPFRLAQALGCLIGWLNWKMHTKSARITLTNLRLCYPALDENAISKLAKTSLIETGQLLMETPSIWLGSIDRSRSRIIAVHRENLLDEAINAGKGVIIILPHLGNWELFNLYYNREPQLTALYNPPDNQYLADLLDAVRNRTNNLVVPTTTKGLKALYSALAKGEVVVILPDQVPASGEFAPFFGLPAYTDSLIPRLIRKSGATAICAYVKRNNRKNGFEVEFQSADPGLDSADLQVSTTALNKSIENCIREIPEQYQWEYKRFRTRPPGTEKLY